LGQASFRSSGQMLRSCLRRDHDHFFPHSPNSFDDPVICTVHNLDNQIPDSIASIPKERFFRKYLFGTSTKKKKKTDTQESVKGTTLFEHIVDLEFLATDPEVRFDSRRYQIVWEVLGLERSPLSLVSTIKELLARKSSGSDLENGEQSRRDPLSWPRDTL
jgi:hypothetical protein